MCPKLAFVQQEQKRHRSKQNNLVWTYKQQIIMILRVNTFHKRQNLLLIVTLLND